MDTVLELDGIGKAWGDFSLRDVSFKLPPGYIMGLVGPNGAGKTTIVKLILGLARAETGTVRLFGRDQGNALAAQRLRIGFVHDRPVCYDHLTVERLGALVASFYPSWDSAQWRRLVRDFELPLHRRASALSRGMRVKLALAVALAHRAELLVLDEPTTGLDPVFRRELLERLSGLIEDGRTSVLFSTQILSDLERVGDFVVFLRGGEMLYKGAKDEILDRWGVVRGGPEIAGPLEALPVRGIRKTPMGLDALVEDHQAARAAFGEGAVVERATLDDAFLLLGRDRSEGRPS